MIQQTLVLVKPDGVLRGIVGEIIQRFERVGMKIVAIKMIQATREVLEQHYYKDENWLREKGESYKERLNLPKEADPILLGKEIIHGLIEDTQISPIIAIVLEGHNAVNVIKKITGPTNIEEAPPGTIRGDFSQDTYTLANKSNRPIITIIHATDNPEVAQKEISFWFSQSEIYSYKKPEEDLHYRIRNNA